MRLVDIDALRDGINAFETLSTFKDSPSWPTYTHRTNEIDDVLDEAPVVIEWHKPSEELPEHEDRELLIVIKSMFGDRPIMLIGWYEHGRFVSSRQHDEDEVLAWCYTPSLPEWCEEG